VPRDLGEQRGARGERVHSPAMECRVPVWARRDGEEGVRDGHGLAKRCNGLCQAIGSRGRGAVGARRGRALQRFSLASSCARGSIGWMADACVVGVDLALRRADESGAIGVVGS
jgi:hypothetical protein